MNKMLSFKELEQKSHEADEVLNHLKKLKAEKEKENAKSHKDKNSEDKEKINNNYNEKKEKVWIRER